MNDNGLPNVVCIRRFALALGIPVRAARHLVESGQVRTLQVGAGRKRWVPLSELDRLDAAGWAVDFMKCLD